MGYDTTGASQAAAAAAEGQAAYAYQQQQHAEAIAPYESAFSADGSTAAQTGVGNNLQISDLSHGASVQGAYNYLDGLQTVAFAQAKEAIRNTNELFATFRNGWQGSSEETFEKNMSEACETISQGLDEVYRAIYNLVSSLIQQYFDQDRKLVEKIDEEVSGFRAGGN